jgi:hypothetical protein
MPQELSSDAATAIQLNKERGLKQASVCVERNTQAAASDMSESHQSKKRLDVVCDYTTFAIGFRKLCALILMRRGLASPVAKHGHVPV